MMFDLLFHITGDNKTEKKSIVMFMNFLAEVVERRTYPRLVDFGAHIFLEVCLRCCRTSWSFSGGGCGIE
jgi:hypothetical protein